MRSYEEISNRIMKKGDEIIESRRIRAAKIKHTSYAVSGLCAAVITGVGVWRLASSVPERNNGHNDNDIIISTETTTENTASTAIITTSAETTSVLRTTVPETSAMTGTSDTTSTINNSITDNTTVTSIAVSSEIKADTTTVSDIHTENESPLNSDTTITQPSTVPTDTTTQSSSSIINETTETSQQTTDTSSTHPPRTTTTTTTVYKPPTTTTPYIPRTTTTTTVYKPSTTTTPYIPRTTTTPTTTYSPPLTTTTSLPSAEIEYHTVTLKLSVIDDESGMPVEGLDITVSREGRYLFSYNTADYPEIIKQYSYSATENENVFWDVTISNIPEEYGYEQNTYTFSNVSIDNTEDESIDITLSLHKINIDNNITEEMVLSIETSTYPADNDSIGSRKHPPYMPES